MFAARLIVVAISLAFVHASSEAVGQENAPDRHGEIVLREPSYRGSQAHAPIPVELHQQNTGGSDGVGLCVIASLTANGRYQNVPGIERLWNEARRRPGGYYPEKLEALIDEVLPGERYASYVGTDFGVVQRLNSRGYPVGVTMNTGALYGYRPIHHMVSLSHSDEHLTAVIDNNRPGFWSWMPTSEFRRRWIDGGTGWAVVWTRLPGLGLVGVVALGVGLGLLLILTDRRTETAR